MLERLEALEERFEELNRLMADPELAQDYEEITQYAIERSELEERVMSYRTYRDVLEEIAATEEMLHDEDPAIRDMAQEELHRLVERREALEDGLRRMLIPKDPRDDRDVIMEIRAGAGGDEAGLFAAELFRLYTRYAERQPKWKTEMISESRTGIGGYKEVIFSIKGRGAYSRLKFESGVHRVQRVPVTESAGRIHTSTVTVAVLPEVDEVEVKINPGDLEIDTYGSSGPGGQHMQKNETAVRITHIPSGIVVACQNERSQTQNRETALRIIRARLILLQEEERRKQIDKLKGEHVDAGWGNQIRSYVLHPYQMVKDHRTDYETGNVQAVLDGNLDPFMEAYLRDTLGKD